MTYLHLLILNLLLTHEWQQSWEQRQPCSADVTVTVYVEVFTRKETNRLIQTSLAILPDVFIIFWTNTFFMSKGFGIL